MCVCVLVCTTKDLQPDLLTSLACAIFGSVEIAFRSRARKAAILAKERAIYFGGVDVQVAIAIVIPTFAKSNACTKYDKI